MRDNLQIKVERLNDYIQAILPFQQRAFAQIHRFGSDRPGVLFRGQGVEQSLVAKIAHLVAGKNTPIAIERKRLSAIKSKLKGKFSDWDAMVLAQHHGVETRFLDWTSNGLVALFFAIGKVEDRHDKANVWVLETREEDFYVEQINKKPIPEQRQGKTVIFAPKDIDSRVLAQDSYMMRQVYVKDGQGKLIMEPVDRNETFRGRLYCLDIDFCGRTNDIRKELSQYGYTERSVMPTETVWDEIRCRCEKIVDAAE